MSKKYSEEQVNEIVQNALNQQMQELEKENRLTAIEDAIAELREDLDKLLENSKKMGF